MSVMNKASSDIKKILGKVTKTIKKYSMLSGREIVLVGISGGPDSVCLLHILNELKDAWQLTLHALYIDHGLRPDETPYEIEFCKGLTGSLKIPFTVEAVDVRAFSQRERLNLQESARNLRYLTFEEHAHQVDADRIATGHHATDQAETIIMQMLRGSGIKGLSGISPVRGKIIRPLIELERKEIEQYLDKQGSKYIMDSSNLQMDYLRNRLRHEVMPLLNKFNPNLTKTLCRTADILREENDYIETTVTKSLMRLISRKCEDTIELFLTPLEYIDQVILRRALMRVIDETRGLREIGFDQIQEIISLIRGGSSGSRIYLPRGIRAIKGYSTLAITASLPKKLKEYTLEVPGETLLKESGLVLISSIGEESSIPYDRNEAVFDADMLHFPLKIRSRRPGDFFYPFGFAKRKKLQDFFVDEKVPRDARDTIPLLISGEDIIWVVGYRTDERYKVESSSRRVLRILVRMARW